MSKLHFLIGQLPTETVNSEQLVLLLLPETIQPALLATYSAQVYPGLKLFVRLGNAKNIFSGHFLPLIGAGDKNALATKKRDLNTARTDLEEFSGDNSKRVGVFVNYLSANKLIDRKLYPLVEKMKRDVVLTNKDLTPLIDAVYTSLRKNASATSAHKEKIRAYIQSGEYDASLVDWFYRYVDPRFGLFQQTTRLANEVEESEKNSRVSADPALMRNFIAAVEELGAGKSSEEEIQGINVQSWLESMIGGKVEPSFFGEVRAIKAGVNNNGTVRLESPKAAQDMPEPAPKLIPLDQFSRMVTALDKALSVLVMDYANADAEINRLYDNQTIQYGLLIRAFLGEADAVRTLYPKHVVGIPGKPEVDQAIIARTHEGFEDGSIARLGAANYGIEEQALQTALEKAVAIQQKILPLLPFEIHQLVDASETAGRLKKLIEKLEGAGGQTANPAQLRAMQISIKAQDGRAQQISKRLKADFRVDVSKLFLLEESVVDDLQEFFGAELACLRAVLAPAIEAAKAAEEKSEEKTDEAAPVTEEMKTEEVKDDAQPSAS